MTDITPPDRRENDDWKDYLENRMQKFFAKALVAFAVIGIACAISLVGFTHVLSEQGKQADRIQEERFSNLLMNCQEQNKRHQRTIAKAGMLNKSSRSIVNALVDELVPFNPSCYEYANSRVGDRR